MHCERMKPAEELLPVRMRFAIKLDEPWQQKQEPMLNASEAIHAVRVDCTARQNLA